MLPEFEEISKIFASLPGIGNRSASRIVFYLLKQSTQYIQHISNTMLEFRSKIEYCIECGAIKSIESKCKYCALSDRSTDILCVVEEPSDIYLIENTNEFQGLYHVLMGVLSPLDGIGPGDIRLAALKKRVQENEKIKEVIIATNPTIEGNATAHYIASMLQSIRLLQVTRISSGLAAGSYLDFADSQVILESLKTRIPIKL